MRLTMSTRQIGQYRKVTATFSNRRGCDAGCILLRHYAENQPNLGLWTKGATEATEKVGGPLLDCPEAL